MGKSFFHSKKRNHQGGFSLPEAMIAAGLIVTMALLVAKFNLQSAPASKTSRKRSCDSLTHSVIEAVKQRGIYNRIFNFVPLRNNRTPGMLFSHAPIVTDADLWNQNGNGVNEFAINRSLIANPYSTMADELEENRAGYALIDSYIRTLSAIYNTNPGVGGFCGTWQPYVQFTPMLLGAGTDLRFDSDLNGSAESPANIEIQIRPYRLEDGSPAPCPAIMRIRPPAGEGMNSFETTVGGLGMVISTAQTQTTTYAASEYFTNRTYDSRQSAEPALDRRGPLTQFAASSDDIGLTLHVRATYTQDDTNISCEAAQKFQYYPDASGPPNPTVSVISNDSVPSVSPNYKMGGPGATQAARTVNVQIAYAGAEAGTQLFCRDRSERMDPYLPNDPDNPTGSALGCYDETQWVSAANRNYAAVRGLPENTRAALAGLSQEWVPCDMVTACGVAPTASTFLPGAGATDPPGYRNTYTLGQARWGCDIIIDAIAIDAAGNRSDINLANPANSAIGTNAFGFQDNGTGAGISVVHPPRCTAADENTPAAQLGIGDLTEFGWLCTESNTYYWTGPESTHSANDWNIEFPNGYFSTYYYTWLGNTYYGCCWDFTLDSTCTPR